MTFAEFEQALRVDVDAILAGNELVAPDPAPGVHCLPRGFMTPTLFLHVLARRLRERFPVFGDWAVLSCFVRLEVEERLVRVDTRRMYEYAFGPA